MVCTRITHLKKYNARPSPPFPANNIDCHFRTFVGKDGFLWSSQPNVNGIFHWVRVLKKQTQKKKSPRKSIKKSPKKVLKKSHQKIKKSPKKVLKKSHQKIKKSK